MEGNRNVVDLTRDDEKVLTARPASAQNPPSAMPEAACFMKDVHEHDVLFSGPGGSLDMMNRHVGNVRFEKLCRQMKDKFLSSSSIEDRRSIAQHVVASVNGLGPPGRFLVVFRDETARNAWKGREIYGQVLLGKVLDAFEIILGLNNKKRKWSVHQDSRTGEPSIPAARAHGAITPQSPSSVPEEAPSQSALAKLATAAEISRRPPSYKRAPSSGPYSIQQTTSYSCLRSKPVARPVLQYQPLFSFGRLS